VFVDHYGCQKTQNISYATVFGNNQAHVNIDQSGENVNVAVDVNTNQVNSIIQNIIYSDGRRKVLFFGR
jgi:hypothetical protein